MKNVNRKTNKKDKIKFNAKGYLKNFLKFIQENIEKTTLILIIIAVLLIAITLKFSLDIVNSLEYKNIQKDLGYLKYFVETVGVLFVLAFSGIVPYLYAPIVGFVGYMLAEVGKYALIINEQGFVVGTLINFVPLLINILCISTATAIGIYICKMITVGYKISNIKNMNFLNFRIKLYEAMNKPKMVENLEKKKEEKLNKLESKKQKIQYLQILNVAVLVSVLQLISTLIQYFAI